MRDIQRGKAGSLHGDKVGIGTLISMVIYLRMFGSGKMPEQRPALAVEIWEKEVRRVFGPLASQVLAKSPSQPPQGAAWEEQSRRIEQAMQHFGFATVNSFRQLLPQVRDLIQTLGGPVRPDQLGYSEQDAYDAIAFGKEVRVKFTALRLAERFGWLYDLADEISLGLPRGIIY
jgi:glycerol-1-phosphate dehydrogenase [NAD(P)+]